MWTKVKYSKAYQKRRGDMLVAEVYLEGKTWKGRFIREDRVIEGKTAKEVKCTIDEIYRARVQSRGY